VLAERIVNYRQSSGKYKTAEQLLDVSGIGPKKLEQIKKFIILESNKDIQ